MSPSRVRLAAFGCLLFLIPLIPAHTKADEPADHVPTSLAQPGVQPLIASGEPVAECGWPTVVAVVGDELCTGALVHPELVVYSGQCGDEPGKVIRLGENAFADGREVAVEFCRRSAVGQHYDWAYCRLAEPITELPVTPPLYGCDMEGIQAGTPVALVGFGATEQLPEGQKHWVSSSIDAIDRDDRWFSLNSPDPGCSGDLGAPALVRLSDGSWRLLGIAASVASPCGSAGVGAHDLLEHAVSWLELDSGLDLTPCYTSNGWWAPGPTCSGYYAQAANVGSGDWSDWCAGTAAAGDADTCGPAWDQFDPKLGPQADFISPHHGEVFELGASVRVEVHALKHPDGFSIRRVSAALDGEVFGAAEREPWLFDTPPLDRDAVYELEVFAEDWAGNVASAELMIASGTAQVPSDSLPEKDIDLSQEHGGCSVSSAVPSPWWLLGLLMPWRRRQGRRRA